MSSKEGQTSLIRAPEYLSTEFRRVHGDEERRGREEKRCC